MPATLAQRKYDANPEYYETDWDAPPSDVHCWYTFGPWARLGKSGKWKRTMGWLWLIAPKGELPQ